MSVGVTTITKAIIGTGVTIDQSNIDTSAGIITASTFSGALTGNVTGTIQTAAQANITSVGTLTGLTVSADATINGHRVGRGGNGNAWK